MKRVRAMFLMLALSMAGGCGDDAGSSRDAAGEADGGIDANGSAGFDSGDGRLAEVGIH